MASPHRVLASTFVKPLNVKIAVKGLKTSSTIFVEGSGEISTLTGAPVKFGLGQWLRNCLVPAFILQMDVYSYRLLWDTVVATAVLYNVFMVPFRISFLGHYPAHLYALDACFDAIYLIDMYRHMRVIPLDENGREIRDVLEISSFYWGKSGRKYIDVLSGVPFELVAYLLVTAMGASHAAPLVVAILRTLKLLRLFRLPHLLNNFEDLVEDVFAFGGMQAGFRMFQLLVGVLVFAHWAACFFYGCGRLESRYWSAASGACMEGDPCMWDGTWIALQIDLAYLPENGGTVAQHYLRALNWALPTLVVVVIGDVIPVSLAETCYVLFWLVIGVSINAVIIGNISNVVANLGTDHNLFIQRIDGLRGYLHTNNLPKHIQERCMGHIDHLSEKDGLRILKEEHIVSDFPLSIRYALSDALRLQFVQKVPLFARQLKAIQRELAMQLLRRSYSPNDTVVNFGDVGQEMYFIESGSVQVVAPDRRTILATLCVTGVSAEFGGSSYFGETAMMSQAGRRGVFVIAMTFCVMHMLTRESLIDVFNRFPDTHFQSLLYAHKQTCDVNSVRNAAVQANVQKMKAPGSKLHRMIFDIKDAIDGKQIAFLKTRKKAGNAAIAGRNKQEFSMVNVQTRTNHNRRVSYNHDQIDVSLLKSWVVGSPTQRWSYVLFATHIYFAIGIPFRIAFYIPDSNEVLGEVNRSASDVLLTLFTNRGGCLGWDYLGDIILWADMLHMLRREFRENSARSIDPVGGGEVWSITYRFRYHLLAHFPTGIAMLFLHHLFYDFFDRHGFSLLLLLAIARLPRLLWLYRMHALADTCERCLLRAMNVRINASVAHLVRMLSTYTMANHWFACGWFFIHRYLERHEPMTWAIADGLAVYNPMTGEHDMCSPLKLVGVKNGVFIMTTSSGISKCYSRAFHFVITVISTVGYGDISPRTDLEVGYQLVVVLMGASLFGAIIGVFAAVFESLDAYGISAFRAKMQMISRYVNENRHLPKELQREILTHHKRQWERCKCINEREVCQDLPIPLQEDIALHLHANIFRIVPALRSLDECAMRRLALGFHFYACSQNVNVYEAGDIGHEIYFISRGSVRVVQKHKSIEALDKSLRQININGGVTNSLPQAPDQKRSRHKRSTEALDTEKNVSFKASGQFFGEGTLTSASGVRLDTCTVVVRCELYIISKEDLEEIMRYQTLEQRAQLIRELLRNYSADDANVVQKHTDGVLEKVSKMSCKPGPTDPPSPNLVTRHGNSGRNDSGRRRSSTSSRRSSNNALAIPLPTSPVYRKRTSEINVLLATAATCPVETKAARLNRRFSNRLDLNLEAAARRRVSSSSIEAPGSLGEGRAGINDQISLERGRKTNVEVTQVTPIKLVPKQIDSAAATTIIAGAKGAIQFIDFAASNGGHENSSAETTSMLQVTNSGPSSTSPTFQASDMPPPLIDNARPLLQKKKKTESNIDERQRRRLTSKIDGGNVGACHRGNRGSGVIVSRVRRGSLIGGKSRVQREASLVGDMPEIDQREEHHRLTVVELAIQVRGIIQARPVIELAIQQQHRFLHLTLLSDRYTLLPDTTITIKTKWACDFSVSLHLMAFFFLPTSATMMMMDGMDDDSDETDND
jgi:CRP-like cAMP-binding protein